MQFQVCFRDPLNQGKRLNFWYFGKAGGCALTSSGSAARGARQVCLMLCGFFVADVSYLLFVSIRTWYPSSTSPSQSPRPRQPNSTRTRKFPNLFGDLVAFPARASWSARMRPPCARHAPRGTTAHPLARASWRTPPTACCCSTWGLCWALPPSYLLDTGTMDIQNHSAHGSSSTPH